MSCVYFIKHRNMKAVKIGFTQEDNPNKRIRDFEVASPFGIINLGYIITEDAKQLEKKLHELYSDLHIKGEWYELSDDEVYAIISRHKYSNMGDLEQIRKQCEKWKITPRELNNLLKKYVEGIQEFPLLSTEKEFFITIKNIHDNFGYGYRNNSYDASYLNKQYYIEGIKSVRSISRSHAYRLYRKYSYMFDEKKDGKTVYAKFIWSEEE